MKFNKPKALCLLIALGLQTNAIASNTSNIENIYFNKNSVTSNHLASIDSDGNIFGDPSVFMEDDEYILTSEEWYKIQLFGKTALSLPVTERDMRSQFKMTDDLEFDGTYVDLLASYRDIYDIGNKWLAPNGYREQMVDLSSQLSNYSLDVVTDAEGLQVLTQYFIEAALNDDQAQFESLKSAITKKVERLNEQVTSYSDDAKKLDDELTNFILILDKEQSKLKIIEDNNAELLLNDGSAIQANIDRLIVEKDQLNEEYAHWVKVSATTPTYGWIFPLGTIAAISTAAAGTAEALQLKAKLDAKKQEIEDLSKEYDHTSAVYSSWKLATKNITDTKGSIADALNSLSKLKGAWHDISNQLEFVLVDIESITTEQVINGDDMISAAFGTSGAVSKIVKKWQKIGDSADAWNKNAYITEQSAHSFK